MSIKNVTLPSYTKGEEIFNSVSHGAGIVLGILSLFLCISNSTNGNSIAGSIVFSLAMIILYSGSTVYHAIKPSDIKRVFRLIDHCVIFVLIAGTSTALSLINVYPLYPAFSVIMTVVSLSLSILGIVLTIIDHEKYKKVQMALYMIVGWISLVLIYPLYKGCQEPWLIISLVFAGGVVYTVGTVFYAVGKKKKYFHSIFHLFVLAGSAFHLAAIYLSL